MRSYEEIRTSTIFTDAELDHAIELLSAAETALRPLGPHYALALNDVVRQLEAFRHIRWMRDHDAGRFRAHEGGQGF